MPSLGTICRACARMAIVGALGFASGCGAADHPALDHSAYEPTPLTSTLLSMAPAIGIPARLQVASDVLWVADARRDPSLHVLDATTGALLHSLARRGDGPGDFVGVPFALELDPDNPRAIWALDQQVQRLTRFQPLPISDYEFEMVRLEGTPRVQRIVRVRADRFIGVGQSIEARFAIYSATGARERVEPGTLNGSADIPERQRWLATNGAINVCAWPGRGFAIANHGFGRIEFYDQDARWMRNAHVPFPSEPLFEDGRYVLGAGYLDCSANQEYLFAVFGGGSNSGDLSTGDIRSASATLVHVFDWMGNLLNVFELDRDIGAISVDPAGAILFGASVLDSGIYRFQLPVPLAEDSGARK